MSGTAGSCLTVVDWNVNGFVHRAQAGLLAGLDWDVAYLQEVTRGTWEEFRALGDAGDVAFNYLPPLAGAGPRYGCAVVVRHGVTLGNTGKGRQVERFASGSREMSVLHATTPIACSCSTKARSDRTWCWERAAMTAEDVATVARHLGAG